MVLQLLLHLADILNHEAVFMVSHVGHPVVHPESGGPREVEQIAIAHPIALRHTHGGGINGIEDSHIRIVHTEPEDATNLIRQPLTHLRNNDKAGLLRSDRTLVGIFHAIYLEGHRTPTIGHLIRACTGILGHIQIGSLIMVAHALLHILHGELTIGLDIERHRLLGRIALDKVCILVHRGIILPEERPDTSLTATKRTKVIRAIGLLEAEVRILAFEVALLTGERDDIRRIEAVLLVVKRDLLDARLVGVGRNAIVWNTDRHPDSALSSRSFTDHLHDPSLLLIGNREGLTATIIAIFSDQVCHHLNGLTSGLRPLQGDIDQAAIVHDAGRISQFMATAEGTLRDGQLMLVHVAYHVIGVLYLGNRA